jgi:hypothetical protein
MRRIILFSVVAVVLCRLTLTAETQPADTVQALGPLSMEDLITKLQDESSQGIGTHESALASGFMAINDQPKFNGGIIGSAKPVISPVMRELVRRGSVALPLLIEHLSDARPTKLVVDHGMAKWFGNEYDSRNRDKNKLPPGVGAPFSSSGPTGEREFDHYTIKVGDLCFVAVGQIVNRQLNAVRYQPSMCLVVNSPVETPALAAAVKADWNGLTPAEHQRSLEHDAVDFSDPFSPPEALKRLLFYYPADTPLAIRLLNHPFPANDPKHPSELSFSYHQRFVDALVTFSSAPIDQAVYDLLKRTSEAHPDNVENIYERCELVHSCAFRLTKPSERDAFEKSYRGFMSSFPSPPESDTMTAFSKRFQVYLNNEIDKLAPK